MKTLNPKVHIILQKYIEEMNLQRIPIDGFYVYGSISLGDYSISLSDIDFITVLTRELNKDEIKTIELIHKRIEQSHKKPNLDGIYIQRADLGKFSNDINPFPYYHDGKMYESGHFEINSVTWYGLKKYGITIFGRGIEELDFEVDWDLLISNMRKNLNTYWLGWISKYKDVNSNPFFGELDLEWGVLGISRLYYTFRENDITSKVRAGQYAISVLPEVWHNIINEAINIRRNTVSLDNQLEHKREEALKYMEYLLNQCNDLFN